MNFKSQISTTREQLERLLALGVKPGPGDMYLEKCRLPEVGDYYTYSLPNNVDAEHWFSARMNRDIIPAWSLSRLIEMMPKLIIINGRDYMLSVYGDFYAYSYYVNGNHVSDLVFVKNEDEFEGRISLIEWLIANGHFNKEYLV